MISSKRLASICCIIISSISQKRAWISAFGITRSLPFKYGQVSTLSTTSSQTLKTLSNEVEEITENGVYIVKQMPPPLPELKNSYYLLRHGQSWGNVEAVIFSSRSLATSEKHGLTPLGYDQGKISAKKFLRLLEKEEENGKRIFFYSSPFARARQTAQASLDGLSECKDDLDRLGLDLRFDVILEDGLMER